jgi:hypothetical protein
VRDGYASFLGDDGCGVGWMLSCSSDRLGLLLTYVDGLVVCPPSSVFRFRC